MLGDYAAASRDFHPTAGDPSLAATPREVHRLTRDAYDSLRKRTPRPVVSGGSSPTEAAYLLGVAYVMDLLRDGFVVDL